jgi:hypothetical protein
MVKKMDSDCVKANEGTVQHPTMLTAVFIVVMLSVGQYWYHLDYQADQMLCGVVLDNAVKVFSLASSLIH